jgi:hypothetical protein
MGFVLKVLSSRPERRDLQFSETCLLKIPQAIDAEAGIPDAKES